jgi:hypothetical protein
MSMRLRERCTMEKEAAIGWLRIRLAESEEMGK